jgi:hypothetical protein
MIVMGDSGAQEAAGGEDLGVLVIRVMKLVRMRVQQAADRTG